MAKDCGFDVTFSHTVLEHAKRTTTLDTVSFCYICNAFLNSWALFVSSGKEVFLQRMVFVPLQVVMMKDL